MSDAQRTPGVAVIDGYNFPSKGYDVQSYTKQLLNSRSWLRLVSGKSEVYARARRGLKMATAGDSQEFEPQWEMPSQNKFLQDIKQLVDKKVNVYFIYAKNGQPYHNYKRYFSKELQKIASKTYLKTEVIRDADHLFTLLSTQLTLIDLLKEWLKRMA